KNEFHRFFRQSCFMADTGFDHRAGGDAASVHFQDSPSEVSACLFSRRAHYLHRVSTGPAETIRILVNQQRIAGVITGCVENLLAYFIDLASDTWHYGTNILACDGVSASVPRPAVCRNA